MPTENSFKESSAALQVRGKSPAAGLILGKYGKDPEAILAAFNPRRQMDLCCDVEKCYNGDAPLLLNLAQAYGVEIARIWIEIQVNDLEQYAGCTTKLDDYQRQQFASLFYAEALGFKLTEIMCFFVQFKQARYGRFFGAIDPLIIFEGLRAFKKERILELLRQRHQQEQKEREKHEMEHLSRVNRYRQRVVALFDDESKCPMNFSQYLILGFDSVSDDELLQTLVGMENGSISLPTDVHEMYKLHIHNQK